jgi:hypothetical protein
LAFKILGKENSQEAIIDVAKNAEDSNIRRDALKLVTDQSIIADFAKNDSDWNVRKAAVEKLTDQSVLNDIARNDENKFVRKVAVSNLTDQNLLNDITKNDEDFEVRQLAYAIIGKENSHEALLDVAKNGSNYFHRKSALIKLLEKEGDNFKSKVRRYFENNLSLTNLWLTNLFSQYHHDEINELVLSSVASALTDEVFIVNKKRQFQLSDGTFNDILKLLSTHGNISVLTALSEEFVKDYSFSYTIDRHTNQPYDYEEKRKNETYFWRTTQIFECISNILSGLKMKLSIPTIEKLNKHYEVRLIREEVTFIGDDSHDQKYVDNFYFTDFQKYIEVK